MSVRGYSCNSEHNLLFGYDENFASLQLFVLKALAEVQALKTMVQSKDEMIKLLTKERDQALATLNRNGLMADRNIEVCNISTSI